MYLSCNGTTIALDSSKGDITFLSHAHSDHASGLKRVKKIMTSPATLELAGLSAEQVEVPGARMLDAGHIFGSRQLLVEADGKRTVYTGDISLKENIFGSKAEIPECDRLIIEATYGGMPGYPFPSNMEIYDEIASWVERNNESNILVGAYEMGKAQEIVKVLNEYCGLAPLVTEKTERNCQILERNGIHLDRAVVGSDEAEEIMSDRFVGIVPMKSAKRHFASRLSDAFGRNTLCAVATGWAMIHPFNTDNSFPLSDHADFNDLKYYIESSGAREVEFFCGDGSSLMRSLASKNIIFKH